MTWMQRLVETYDACAGRPQFESAPLPPVAHAFQQAHVEITIDGDGRFRRAEVIAKEETLVPATEASSGRSGTKPPPHPLCDKVQYVASDYPKYGGKKPSFHAEYLEQLAGWCKSSSSHPKINAVLAYVERGTVVADLIQAGCLHVGNDSKLLTKWDGDEAKPDILKILPATSGEVDQGGAFVRWRVEIPGDLEPCVWRDPALQNAWVAYYASLSGKPGICMATGKTLSLTTSHPKRIRHPGDGAKLISSNDSSGYTFRGRFTDATGDQACGVGYETSQKAHAALRWLIQRQAYRHGEQVFVAWATTGDEVPDPLADTWNLLGLETSTAAGYQGDAGQEFSRAVKKKIQGYRSALGNRRNVVLMGLDAATPGRMSITYYHEFEGQDFLDRIEAWHENFAWPQHYSKETKFVGSSAPRDIAVAAYGGRLDDRLRSSCVERLLPCIVEGRPLPRNLMESVVRRASSRASMEPWEWLKTLGIACSLVKGAHPERNYDMTLEIDRRSRDYLYGRLLAVADALEGYALFKAQENRDTTAARLMQRFSDRPYSTWRTIELALGPYMSRLRSSAGGSLHWYKQQLDDICTLFETADFTSDRKLSGEFLIGYHCQRAALHERKPADAESNTQPKEEN